MGNKSELPLAEKPAERCETCRFLGQKRHSKELGVDTGSCQRGFRHVQDREADETTAGAWWWPIHELTDWCGEWQPKALPPRTPWRPPTGLPPVTYTPGETWKDGTLRFRDHAMSQMMHDIVRELVADGLRLDPARTAADRIRRALSDHMGRRDTDGAGDRTCWPDNASLDARFALLPPIAGLLDWALREVKLMAHSRPFVEKTVARLRRAEG